MARFVVRGVDVVRIVGIMIRDVCWAGRREGVVGRRLVVMGGRRSRVGGTDEALEERRRDR